MEILIKYIYNLFYIENDDLNFSKRVVAVIIAIALIFIPLIICSIRFINN